MRPGGPGRLQEETRPVTERCNAKNVARLLSALGLGRVKTAPKRRQFSKQAGSVSGRDGGNQRLDPDDIHYSSQIIGQDREGHLGGHF
jgi:hypothetical protein